MGPRKCAPLLPQPTWFGDGTSAALQFSPVLAALLSIAVLASQPAPDAPRRTRLTVRLSVGGFLGSVWAAPSYRASVDRITDQAVSDLYTHASLFDAQNLWQAAPVIGPWLVLAQGGYQAQQDMPLLVLSGLLQAIGLSTLTYRLVTERPAQVQKSAPADDGPSLEISPVVANRLGLALTLTGI
jgi:hypothetical protein